MTRYGRARRGTSFIEALTTAIILIPIALCFLDLIVLVIANTYNDTAAKNAARAAANQPDGKLAFEAAQKALASVKSSALVKTFALTIEMFDYPANRSVVTCKTKIVVHLPVPFPGLSEVVFMAKAAEPIVAR
ncbi:MAG TPA: hypothetical protein V6D17_03630 [Candidatus Obscuribacterales bacterium]